jgi:hypothetical protein
VDEVTLFNLLKSTGLPVAYHHFTSPPEPSYIVYLFAYSSNFGADNKVHSQADNYQVELYTKTKDPAAEALIEGLFDDNDIYWEKTETFIESEGLYQVLYEI